MSLPTPSTPRTPTPPRPAATRRAAAGLARAHPALLVPLALFAFAASDAAAVPMDGPSPDTRGQSSPAQTAPADDDAARLTAPEIAGPDSPLPPPERAPSAALKARLDRVLDADHDARPSQDDPYAAIDACMEAELAGRGIVGASLAVRIDGELTHARGFGLKSAAGEEPVDTETIFRIGSTTKQMTAAALLQLVEAGEVDLDAPVTDYLPELSFRAPWDAADIRVEDLLTHEHAIPDNYFTDLEAPLASIESALRGIALNADPGSFWNYSNPGFSLAGRILEVQDGEPFGDLMQRRVWRPAGMALTTMYPTDVISHGNYATGHEGAVPAYPPDAYELPIVGPAGMAFSTSTELSAWAQLLADGGGDVLSADSAAAMMTRQVGMGYREWEGYGYGVIATDWQREGEDGLERVTVYDHGGNIYGFSSQLFWIPEDGVAFSILANSFQSMTYAAGCAVRALTGLEPIPNPPALSPEGFPPLEATYAMQNVVLWDVTARVAREDDHLRMSYLDLGPSFSILPVFNDVFVVDQNEDGTPDGQDFSFIREDDAPPRWLRNRGIVGQRVGDFPEGLALQGEACETLAFTPAFDMPAIQLRASGLAAPIPPVLGEPIAQDDPADPASASYKMDLQVRGEAGLMILELLPADAADQLGLYLMHDADADGDFAFPEELVGVGQAAGGGAQLFMTTGRPPGGAYQVWVQGVAIASEDPRFDLNVRVVDGEQLALVDPPTMASAGEMAAVEVCARDVAGLDPEQSWEGIVELDYGYSPRRVRIPVSWTPEAVNGLPHLYLPWTGRDAVGD